MDGTVAATSGFDWALNELKSGNRVARAGWNGKDMWIELVDYRDWKLDSSLLASDLERLPWLGMRTADRKFVPWLASQTDILANDWLVVVDE